MNVNLRPNEPKKKEFGKTNHGEYYERVLRKADSTFKCPPTCKYDDGYLSGAE